MISNAKLFFLGVLLFCSPKLFIKCGRCLFPQDFENEHSVGEIIKSSNLFRDSFLYALKFNVLFFMIIIATIYFMFGDGLLLRYYEKHMLLYIDLIKVISAFIALTVTLGRGGWAIQTNKGNSLTERIDKGIFKISQYVSVSIMLVTILWPVK